MVLSTRAVLSVDGDDEAVAAEGAVHERRMATGEMDWGAGAAAMQRSEGAVQGREAPRDTPPASVADLASASATHLLPDAPPHVTHLFQIPDNKPFKRFKEQLFERFKEQYNRTRRTPA